MFVLADIEWITNADGLTFQTHSSPSDADYHPNHDPNYN